MKNIVVVGAGFGGLKTALKLDKKLRHAPGYRVILIDKNSYQTYTPALYEVASAYRGSGATYDDFEERLAGVVCLNIHEIISGTDINFVQEEVKRIDTKNKIIKTKANNSINYEYCIIATGSEIDCGNIKHAEENCVSLKSVQEALYIRDRVEALFQELVQSKEKKNIHINVIGTGFSGVEVASELAKYAGHLAKAAYNTDKSKIKIRLIGSEGDVLAGRTQRMRKLARERLESLGIKVITNAYVTSISKDKVRFKGGKVFPSDLTIWAGGVKASSLIDNVRDVATKDKGKVVVDNYLRAKDKKDVFVIGDCAYFKDGAGEFVLPEMAWVAEQQSEVAARNVYALVYDYPFEEYVPRYIGFVSSAGGKYALADLYGITFAGWPAWLVKRLIDFKYLVSVHNLTGGTRLWLKSMSLFTRND